MNLPKLKMKNDAGHILHPGDRVLIYQDPFTEKKLEGQATVKKVICRHIDHYRLQVLFDGDAYDQIVECEKILSSKYYPNQQETI